MSDALRELKAELRDCGTAEVSPWFLRFWGGSIDLLCRGVGATWTHDTGRNVYTLTPR